MTHEQPQRKVWLEDIEERCRNMAEISRQRETAQVIQLPLWHEGKRGTPNSFMRSALFAAIQGKDRVYLESAVLFSQKDITVKFTGKQLNQEDMTVWLALVDLALSRDACKNLQDEMKLLAISRFQRFPVGDESLPLTAVECYANSLHNPHTA